MDVQEIARTLDERNVAPENLKYATLLAFLADRGIVGARLQGATRAVSKRHDDCLDIIAMGDGGGRLGERARRRCLENLYDAEDKLHRELDRVLRDPMLQQEWARAWAEMNSSEPYTVDVEYGQTAAAAATRVIQKSGGWR